MTTGEVAKGSLDVVKACLLIDDDKKALSCLQDLIQKWPAEGECKPSLVLLVQGNCPSCYDEHNLHLKAIEDGTIQVVDIDSPRGADIMKRNGIEATPALLILDCADTVIELEEEESAPASSV